MGKILVLAEKPDAGREYAKILGCTEKKIGYLEGPKYIVSWAIGHLVKMKNPDEYKEEWKHWNLETLPIVPENFQLKIAEATKKQFNVIKSLINRDDIDYIINGGDAAREGELIQRYILLMCNNKKPVKRLWVSSLTDVAIREGFNNLKNSSEFDSLYESALARSQIDWLYGLNYTRALTVKYGGQGKVLSAGRCQTPVLKLIVDRDLEIDNFVPEPYFELIADFEDYKGKYIKDKSEKINTKERVNEILNDIKNKTGIIIESKIEKKETQPPQLYNLTGLQKKMNTKYGFTAQKTLSVLQGLYEIHHIATYPRASAKVISNSIFDELKENINNIKLTKFENYFQFLNIVKTKRYVDESKIEDHHAIIPDFKNKNIIEIYNTKLNEDEKRVFDELIKSVLAAFSPNFQYSSSVIITEVQNHTFITKGTEVLNLGWKAIYKDEKDDEEKDEEKIIKGGEKGDKKQVVDAKILSKKTKPKARYTEASILGEMEKYNIGQESTKTIIIETLKARNYIEMNKKNLISTQLGKEFINIVPIQNIKSVELTAQIESYLQEIVDKKNSRENLLKQIINEIEKNLNSLKKLKDEKINSLDEIIGACPICGKGKIRSTSFGYGCSEYKNGCNFSFSKKIAKKEITIKNVKKLIEEGKTDIINGFVSKNGNKFNARLFFDKENNSIKFEFVEENLGTCPICKKGKVRPTSFGYGCSEYKNGCQFSLNKIINGKEMKNDYIKDLIKQGKTNLIEGFISKSGKKYNAYLEIDKENKKIKISFDSNRINKSKIVCPKCNIPMINTDKVCKCDNCNIVIFKVISKKKISDKFVKQLLADGLTEEIDGFISAKGNVFSARLKLENGKVLFDF